MMIYSLTFSKSMSVHSADSRNEKKEVIILTKMISRRQCECVCELQLRIYTSIDSYQSTQYILATHLLYIITSTIYLTSPLPDLHPSNTSPSLPSPSPTAPPPMAATS
jgi:hypothetical protein